jgi:hypothetical protein
MEAADVSKTLEPPYQTIWDHIAEGCNQITMLPKLFFQAITINNVPNS